MILKKDLGTTEGGRNAPDMKSEYSKNRRVLNNVSNTFLLDEKDSSGTVTGTSCTSGITSRAIEIQQKLRWRKNQRHEKNKVTNNNELPEISEEYDIQTIISGLTRNSEFPERRDPPDSVSGDDNGIDHSVDWPDDETLGQRGHHVIRIMDGNQVASKDTIRFDQKNRVSRCHEENVSEPREVRSELPTKETVTSKVDIVPQKESDTGYEMMLACEPEGTKLWNGRQKSPKEPSGKKMETLIYSCVLKNENPRNKTDPKSCRQSHKVLMNDQDVEVVYQGKDLYVSEQTKGKISRRRSNRTNAGKRTHATGYPLKDTNKKRNDCKAKDMSHGSIDGKRRSRSLPRTLKRITSRYRKGEGAQFKGDPPPQKKNLSSPFIDEIVGVVENMNVSALGSQCDGIENQASRRKETEKVPTKHSHETFSPHSPHSREAMYSPPSWEAMCEKSEPRVCVEFSRRKSGGRYQTTSYADQKSTDPGNYNERKRDEGKLSRRYLNMETNTPDDASKIVFPGHDRKVMKALSKNFSNNYNKDKVRIDAIAEEASRNLLLSPNVKEDSFAENDDIFERYRPDPNSHLESMQVNNKFATTESNHYSAPVTPSPQKELYGEFSGHKSSASIDDPNVTLLAMTPAGRKDLIQRYLSLREKHGKLETSTLSRDSQRFNSSQGKNVSSFPSGRSVGSVYSMGDDANSILQDLSSTRSDNVKQIRGYDDASKHYKNNESKQWPLNSSSSKEIHATSFGSRSATFSGQMKRVPTPVSSGSMSSMRRSTSERGDMGRTNMPVQTSENLFPLPNAYKQQNNAKESWSSPSVVSSFPYSQQEKLSYSYVSDDDSSLAYKSNLNSPYNFPARSNYEEVLRPHNQFMKMQMGLGN
jgi:hypothetical protein